MPKEICRNYNGTDKKSEYVKCSLCKGTVCREYIIKNDRRVYKK
jgi:hypothetical protein